VTIIWALQSRTSAKITNRRVRAPVARALGVRLGGWVSIVSFPNGVQGRTPAASDFSYIKIQSELIFGHRCISMWLQRLEIVKNQGHQAKRGPNERPGRTVFFSGTHH